MLNPPIGDGVGLLLGGSLRISLIVPCYNEAKNLPGLIERCAAFVAKTGGEVVLVDNGSSDETPAVLAALLPVHPGCRSVRVEVNQGYGFGVLSGLRVAKGDILAWTHADLQTDPCDAVAGLSLFDACTDPARLFVKGRRNGRPAFDVLFTAGMSLFEILLTGRVMRDINAQPTMFHRSFFETWRDPPYDFSLDLYAYWRAKQKKLSVKRFPVRFGERLHGVSHWNTGLAGKWKFIRRTVEYSLRLRSQGVT